MNYVISERKGVFLFLISKLTFWTFKIFQHRDEPSKCGLKGVTDGKSDRFNH